MIVGGPEDAEEVRTRPFLLHQSVTESQIDLRQGDDRLLITLTEPGPGWATKGETLESTPGKVLLSSSHVVSQKDDSLERCQGVKR